MRVSKFSAKKPRVQACVLSVHPPSVHARGSVATQRVDPAHVVVNIPAG